MNEQEFTDKCDKCGCEFDTYWDSQNHVCPEPTPEPEPDPVETRDLSEGPASEPVPEEETEIQITEKKSSRKRRKSRKKRSRKTPEEVTVTEFVPQKIEGAAKVEMVFPDFADDEQPVRLPLNRKRITPNWQQKVLREKPKKLHKYLQ